MIAVPPPAALNEPVPACVRVIVEEPSEVPGGPEVAYPIALCGPWRARVRVLIVDGRRWPERSHPLNGHPAAIVFWQPAIGP